MSELVERGAGQTASELFLILNQQLETQVVFLIGFSSAQTNFDIWFNKISSSWSAIKTHFVSSTISTSGCWVIGVFEWPAVGSSAFNSPLVELTTCKKLTEISWNSTL